MGARIEITQPPPPGRIERVAPLVGARIEIVIFQNNRFRVAVAPLVGARIEILMQDPFNLQVKSLPSWERGLK